MVATAFIHYESTGGIVMQMTMKRRMRGAALAMSLLISGAASPADETVRACHGEPDVCRTLWNGEEELASMLVSGDVGIVGRLFAEDAVWSLASGERWTKREAMAALRKAPRMTDSRLLRVTVHQYGTVAIVLWAERWHDPATNRAAQSFGTDTWMLRDARWQIIASQEARLPAAAAR